jgi:hypothetical protein
MDVGHRLRFRSTKPIYASVLLQRGEWPTGVGRPVLVQPDVLPRLRPAR